MLVIIVTRRVCCPIAFLYVICNLFMDLMNRACECKANATKLLLPSDKRAAEAKEAAEAKAQEEASALLLEEQLLADKVRFIIRKSLLHHFLNEFFHWLARIFPFFLFLFRLFV